MLPKTKTERHSDICKEINALYARKNHDYGDSFHQTFTEEGMAMPRIRLEDKLARFKSLTKSEVQEVKDESIRDTLIDLANYAIMTVLELDDLKAKYAGAKSVGGETKASTLIIKKSFHLRKDFLQSVL